MLGPFATASRRTPMSTTTTTTSTTTTTTRDRGDRYGPIEWAQSVALVTMKGVFSGWVLHVVKLKVHEHVGINLFQAVKYPPVLRRLPRPTAPKIQNVPTLLYMLKLRRFDLFGI